MRTLLLSSLAKATGNRLTAERISTATNAIAMLDVAHYHDADALRRAIDAHQPIDLVLAVHAYRAGRLLVGLDTPFILILGGTDVNIHRHDAAKLATIRRASKRARAIVAFQSGLLDALLEIDPMLRSKTRLIPQATTSPLAPPSLPRVVPDGGSCSVAAHARAPSGGASVLELLDMLPGEVLLLLPAGLRPVKDVLFVVDALARWHRADPAICLRIVGPELDPVYANSVRRALTGLELPRFAAFVGALPQEHLHAAMVSAAIVLNTSSSEGMCNSILESQLLGTPVVARSNGGNRALVHHGETGVLFENPEECVRLCQSIVQSGELACRLGERARECVLRNHSPAQEAAAYGRLLEEALSASCGCDAV